MLDLNGMKAINDCYGHAAGDQMLRHTEALLQDAGAGNWSVGRLGGDEFAVVSPHDDRELQAQLEAALDATITVAPGVRVAVSAAVGETVLRPGDEVATALRAADEKMYRHKANAAAFVPRSVRFDQDR